MNEMIYSAFADELDKLAAETYMTRHPKYGRVFYAGTDKPSSAPPKVSAKHRTESFARTIKRREVPIRGMRVGKMATAASKPIKDWAIFKKPNRAKRIAKVGLGKLRKSPLAALILGLGVGSTVFGGKKKEKE